MTATVFSFFRHSAVPRDWSAQELAEFYRVEAALIQTGMHVDSERGVTDEGEPWFVFCRVEDDDVVIHFARINGKYVISAPAYCENASGYDFRALVRSIVERHPVLRLRPDETTLYIHPAALLIVLVASAVLKSGEAAAAHAATHGAAENAKWGSAAVTASIASEPEHEAMVLGAINAAITVPVMVDTTSVVAPVAEHAPHLNELSDYSSLPSIESSSQDHWHHPLQVDESITDSTRPTSLHPGGSVTADVMVAQVAPSYAPAVSGAETHPHDSSMVSQGSSLSDVGLTGTVLTQATAHDVATGSSEGGGQLPLSAFANIAPGDLALLQAVGVTSAIASTAGLPNAVPQAIHSSTHVEAGNSQVLDTSIASDGGASTSFAHVTAPVPPPVLGFDVSTVLASVQRFQTVEVQPVVVLTDHAAIFYDAYAIATDVKDVRCITYDFQDGFSISLVGLPAELAHAAMYM